MGDRLFHVHPSVVIVNLTLYKTHLCGSKNTKNDYTIDSFDYGREEIMSSYHNFTDFSNNSPTASPPPTLKEFDKEVKSRCKMIKVHSESLINDILENFDNQFSSIPPNILSMKMDNFLSKMKEENPQKENKGITTNNKDENAMEDRISSIFNYNEISILHTYNSKFRINLERKKEKRKLKKLRIKERKKRKMKKKEKKKKEKKRKKRKERKERQKKRLIKKQISYQKKKIDNMCHKDGNFKQEVFLKDIYNIRKKLLVLENKL
ncbi:australin isoform a-related [Anaeramoeba flamelloides]|uniref:Australin isoform a-related n=1 Tax=Anaeramoeba flamelloides TaxID=1746091 RepID=A0AAV8A4N0_9EUKA|nr:australin isoform a-related [Anaeramoeba flamelloides]